MARRSQNPYRRPGSPYWQILYRDASGRERRESTRSTHLRAAQQILAERRLEAERTRAGIVDRFAASRRRPLDELVQAWRSSMQARRLAPKYVRAVVRHVRDAIAAAQIAHLQDLTVGAVARHLDDVRAKRSAKTADANRSALRAFGAWLVEQQHWPENPLAALRVKSRTRDKDRVFKRRGLTLAELEQLAEAALTRPLQAYVAAHGGRPPKDPDEYERRGRERALLYWFAATTGLRAAELAAVRWEDLQLDGDDPCVALSGRHTKNGRDARLPLQEFVARALADLRRDRGAAAGAPVQQRDHVFRVPDRMPEHVRRDAMHAGLIPTHRPSDRRLDFHALRYSCVRLLRELGVPPEVAQRVMRHSDIRLTLETYGSTDETIVVATMRGRVPVPAMFSRLCSSAGPTAGRHDTPRDKNPNPRPRTDDATAAS